MSRRDEAQVSRRAGTEAYMTYVEVTSTAQRSDSHALTFIQRFLHGALTDTTGLSSPLGLITWIAMSLGVESYGWR